MAQNKEEISRSLTSMAWKRLKRNRPAMFGLVIICIFTVIAILGATIRPDDSTDSDNQVSIVHNKKPGFSCLFLLRTKNDTLKPVAFYKKLFFGGQPNLYEHIPIKENFEFEGSFIKVEKYDDKPASENPVMIPYHLADVCYALHPNNRLTDDGKGNLTFFDMDNNKISTTVAELKQMVLDKHLVKRTYWLGTDRAGRDMLSRLMAGTIISLSVGLISVIISLVIGIFMGAIAGYYRGWVDDLVMYIINVVWSIPTLLLVIAITIALGKGFEVVFIAVGLTMWVEVARIVRGQVLSIREKEYVEAGKSLGYKSGRIIFRHVLPNVMGPVIVVSAANFASAILIEAGMSYLGIGVVPPTPSWGGMIADHKDFITTPLAYLAILPGMFTSIIVLAFMLVGNGLRDALDTRSVDDVKG